MRNPFEEFCRRSRTQNPSGGEVARNIGQEYLFCFFKKVGGSMRKLFKKFCRRSRSLTCMAAGEAQIVERILPLFFQKVGGSMRNLFEEFCRRVDPRFRILWRLHEMSGKNTCLVFLEKTLGEASINYSRNSVGGVEA